MICVGAVDFGCAARGRVNPADEDNTELEALELVEPEDLETNGEIGVTVAGVDGDNGAASGLAALGCAVVADGEEDFASVIDVVFFEVMALDADDGEFSLDATDGCAGIAARFLTGAEFDAAGAVVEPLAGDGVLAVAAGAAPMRSPGKRMPQKPITDSVNSSST